MAGANSSDQGSLPYLSCASLSAASTPGTPTERPLSIASLRGSGLPAESRNKSAVAAAGAVSRPSKFSKVLLAASQVRRNAPPPIPEDCGSTTFSTICVAMAASTALPPLRKMASPASAASGFAATTICRLALTSVFAVKPLGPSGRS